METCRTCAKCDFEDETHNWLDLFHPNAWYDEIQQIQMEICNWKLEITQHDGLPQKICTDCFAKFCNIFTFRLACQDAQIKLNNIFDKIETHSINDDVQYASEAHYVGDMSQNMAANNLANNNAHDMYLYDSMDEHCGLNSGYPKCNAKRKYNHNTDEHNPHVCVQKLRDLLHSHNRNEHASCTALIMEADINYNNNNVHDNYTLTNAQQTKTTNTASTARVENVMPAAHDAYDGYEREVVVGTDMPQQSEHVVVSAAKHAAVEPVDIFHTAPLPTLSTETITTTTALMPLRQTYTCKYCDKSNTQEHIFQSQDELLAHITAMHAGDKYPFKCPNCHVAFQDAASRTVHMKSAHVAKHFKCQVCGKRYADRSNLRHHIEKFHSETDFECQICEKRFYSRKSLKYHMKWHSPEMQLKCRYCERLFINQRHLQCHEATHTGMRNTEYCTFCGKSFIHLKTLRWHIYRQHGGEKPFKCRHCSEAFASYPEKRVHMLEYHLENLTAIEKTECMLCHKQFENDIELKEHMQTEHQPHRKHQLIITNNKRVLQRKREKQYSGIFQCDICAQRFNMKKALDRHAAVHSTEGRPHACPHCSKRFKRVQDMNWHIKTHSNEKPNVCDVCGKGFALKYVLTQHKRSHEVLEKNFVCAVCGRAYLFEKSLRMHERMHTGKTYYKCDLCGESFVTHIKFKSHMRKIHNTNNNPKKVDEELNIVIN